jgi:LysM repeat protein
MAITYTVKKGDTLSAIAAKAGISLKQLIGLNPQIKNPNLINPGQVITTSKSTSTATKPKSVAAALTYQRVGLRHRLV